MSFPRERRWWWGAETGGHAHPRQATPTPDMFEWEEQDRFSFEDSDRFEEVSFTFRR